MTIGRRKFLLAMARAAIPAASNGAVAFHYEAIFGPDAAAWYTRFKILVTGGILADAQTAKLRARGSQLIAYEWSSAFYPGTDSPAAQKWQEAMRGRARDWLLSPDPVAGASAAPGRAALWYDFADPAFAAFRATHLAGRLLESGYDGFFFDTPGFENLPASMQDAYLRRHGSEDYNRCQGAFFAALKARLPGKLIFLNQGYRHAEHFLPHADLDLTESYFTAIDGNRTRFRKWDDTSTPWQAIRTPMEQLVAPAARKYPQVRFVHANYAAGASAVAHRAARFSWACAKLWGHDSYLISPAAYENERDPIYFTPTGRPKPEPYREQGDVIWRAFEKGIVAVNAGPTAAPIKELGLELPEPQQGYFFPAQ